MQATKHIVVWDPEGDYWQGGIVDDDLAHTLRARGVALLPVEPNLMTRSSAAAGFFHRAWGAGWPLGGAVPQMCCPMLLQLSSTVVESATAQAPNRISWVARLVPDPGAVDSDGRLVQQAGQIRLAADSGQPGAFGGGLSPTERAAVSVRELGQIDQHGGWTVGGDALVSVALDAFIGLGLYGWAPGLRVAWAAVSQSR